MSDFYNQLNQEADMLDFKTLFDFASWYDSHGNPLLNNATSEVYVTDDATSIPIFRWKNFQVELYIVHDMSKVEVHAHPYVQVIQKLFYKDTKTWSPFTDMLVYPAEHGKFPFNDSNSLLLTYERWHPKLQVTTLAATWRGKTVGPIQEALIKRLYPNALIEAGYADVSIGLDI